MCLFSSPLLWLTHRWSIQVKKKKKIQGFTHTEHTLSLTSLWHLLVLLPCSFLPPNVSCNTNLASVSFRSKWDLLSVWHRPLICFLYIALAQQWLSLALSTLVPVKTLSKSDGWLHSSSSSWHYFCHCSVFNQKKDINHLYIAAMLWWEWLPEHWWLGKEAVCHLGCTEGELTVCDHLSDSVCRYSLHVSSSLIAETSDSTIVNLRPETEDTAPIDSATKATGKT